MSIVNGTSKTNNDADRQQRNNQQQQQRQTQQEQLQQRYDGTGSFESSSTSKSVPVESQQQRQFADDHVDENQKGLRSSGDTAASRIDKNIHKSIKREKDEGTEDENFTYMTANLPTIHNKKENDRHAKLDNLKAHRRDFTTQEDIQKERDKEQKRADAKNSSIADRTKQKWKEYRDVKKQLRRKRKNLPPWYVILDKVALWRVPILNIQWLPIMSVYALLGALILLTIFFFEDSTVYGHMETWRWVVCGALALTALGVFYGCALGLQEIAYIVLRYSVLKYYISSFPIPLTLMFFGAFAHLLNQLYILDHANYASEEDGGSGDRDWTTFVATMSIVIGVIVLVWNFIVKQFILSHVQSTFWENIRMTLEHEREIVKMGKYFLNKEMRWKKHRQKFKKLLQDTDDITGSRDDISSTVKALHAKARADKNEIEELEEEDEVKHDKYLRDHEESMAAGTTLLSADKSVDVALDSQEEETSADDDHD